MEINKLLTTYNREVAVDRKINYIVIHWVGAVSSAKNNAQYFASKKLSASAHYFIDENEIWQSVEDKNIAWHCGATKYYHENCRNKNSIGIEICCKQDAKGNLYLDYRAIQKAIELTAYLMELHGVKIENVVRHYDVTHKLCPLPFIEDEKAWQDFKSRVENNYNAKEITDIKEALDLLEDAGRMNNRQYWEMVIQTTRNMDFLIIKWANDVKKLV